jgi:ClpP class serine protease
MLKAQILQLIRGNHWALDYEAARGMLHTFAELPKEGLADMGRQRKAHRSRYATQYFAAGSLKKMPPYKGNGEWGEEGEARESDTVLANGIAVVYLKGMVSKDGDWCARGTAAINAELHELGAIDSVKGVLLCIDSAGGSVDGTETLANTIYDYRRRYKKPVWAFVDGQAASAAYWIASGADKIYISGETAAVGSIGTMVQIANYEGIEQAMGIEVITIYATLSTQKNKPYDEALNGNPQPMREQVLDKLNGVFLRSVIRGRYLRAIDYNTLTAENVPEQLAGKMYFGSDAIAIGLADKIATFDNTLQTMYSSVVSGVQPMAGYDKDKEDDDDTYDDDMSDALKELKKVMPEMGMPEKEKATNKPAPVGLRLTPLKSIIQTTKKDNT